VRCTLILVTGATGTVGTELVRQLVEAGETPRVLVRDPAKLGAIKAKVDVAVGDLGRPETLTPALCGVTKVFLLAFGANLPKYDANLIDAAKAAKVEHIVKLSVLTIDEEPPSAVTAWHLPGEEKLRTSGMAWTFLRPDVFMSNTLSWAPTIKEQGLFYHPTGQGKWAPIDPFDIAAVGVAALTKSGHASNAYTLTGPVTLSAGEHAEILTRVLGKPTALGYSPPRPPKGTVQAKAVNL